MSINRVLTREEWDAEIAEMVERSGPIPYASLAAGCALRLTGYVQAGDSSPARKPKAYSYTTNGTTYNVGEDGVTRMAKKSSKKAPPKERPLPPWLNKPGKKGGKKK